MRHFVRLMRPGDWTKNLFVLPAFIFSLPGLIDSEEAVWPWVASTALTIVAFSLVSSGFYALNDVFDVVSDRAHPVKCKRPVASGAISPRTAAIFGVVLVAVGLVCAGLVNGAVVATLGAYAVLQLSYNGLLKRVLFVDVVAIALGFGLRAASGAVAIEVTMSIWLVLCVFFLCLYLGFIKRLCDIASAEAAGDSTWRTAAGYDNRAELNWLLAISAVLAVMMYIMYTLSPHARELFQSRAYGFALLTPLVLIAVHRFYRRANEGLSDSPLSAIKGDRAVLIAVFLFGVGTLITLYAPGVPGLLEAMFELEIAKEALP